MKIISALMLLPASAFAQAPAAPAPPAAAPAVAAPVPPFYGYGAGLGIYKGSADQLYQNGQNALDSHRWEQAVSSFSEVTTRGGAHADGALYWKAYALNKLGRRDEAQSAVADLRKMFPKSRWLEDAQALELEMKQAAGQPVAPENQTDEELKLLALNGLMHSEPDRALPLIENLLKGTQSPKLKKNAVYVIAQSNSPRAQQLLERIARGSGNPDLQVIAIRYYAQQKKDSAALIAMYNNEQSVDVRNAIVEGLAGQKNAQALVSLARNERDPDLKKRIVQLLANLKSPEATEYLLELLK